MPDPAARATPGSGAAATSAQGHGELLGAIDLLSEANRRVRSTALERMLIDLRWRAYARLDRPGLAPSRLTTTAARIDGAAPMPEPVVAAADLTAEHMRAALASHGYLLVRGAVPERYVATLRADIDDAMRARDEPRRARDTGTGPYACDGCYEPFEPRGDEAPETNLPMARAWMPAVGAMLVVDSPRTLFDYTEMMRSTALDRVIAHVMGERPALLTSKCTLRRVAPGATIPDWHQDGSFLRRTGLLNMWVALSEAGRDAPGLQLLPRRLTSIVPTGTEGASAGWTVAPRIVDELAREAPLWVPAFRPGDALFFDDLCLHRVWSAPGMTRQRYSLETWFFAPSHDAGEDVPVML